MSWGDKKNFCDLTDPYWVCLGTHRHPWKLPSRYLQRANFVVFWAISRISKANNVPDKFWIFLPKWSTLGVPGHPQVPMVDALRVPSITENLAFLILERFQEFKIENLVNFEYFFLNQCDWLGYHEIPIRHL